MRVLTYISILIIALVVPTGIYAQEEDVTTSTEATVSVASDAREIGLKIGNQAPPFMRRAVERVESWRVRYWVHFAEQKATTEVALADEVEAQEQSPSVGLQARHAFHTVLYEITRSAWLFYGICILVIILILRFIFR